MKNRLLLICSLAVVAALSISLFTTGVLATDSTSATANDGWKSRFEQRKNHQMSAQNLKKILAKLVTEGTITQEAADEAYSLATADNADKADLSKLPQAIKDAFKAKMPQRPDSTEVLKKILSRLVADKTITQSASDEAYAAATADDSTKADFSKLPQAIKDAIAAKSPKKSDCADKSSKHNSAQMLKNMLSSLVTDGTITQEAADEAYALATADNADKADFSKLPQAIKDAFKAKMPQKAKAHTNNLA